MINIPAFSPKTSFLDYFKTVQYKKAYALQHPDMYPCYGVMTFEGHIGSGKTYSMYCYMKGNLAMFPKLKCITNINSTVYPPITRTAYVEANKTRPDVMQKFDGNMLKITAYLEAEYYRENRIFPFLGLDELMEQCKNIDNGEYGLLIVVDEMVEYATNKKSGKLDDDFNTKLAYLRKEYTHIVIGVQSYATLPIELRRQFDVIVKCKCYFNKSKQRNVAIARALIGDNVDISSATLEANASDLIVSKFWHQANIYQEYNTRQVIKKGEI